MAKLLFSIMLLAMVGSLVSCYCLEANDDTKNVQDSVTLDTGNHLEVRVLQNGSTVPITLDRQQQDTIRLRPEPFSLQLHGNIESASIMALRNHLKARFLELHTQPMVLPAGTNAPFQLGDQHDLLVIEGPLELYEGTEFIEKSCETPDEVAELSSFFERQLGALPFVLVSPHIYLGHYSEPNEDEMEFPINTINGVEIQTDESICLVIFLRHKWLEPGVCRNRLFGQVEWSVLNITFSK